MAPPPDPGPPRRAASATPTPAPGGGVILVYTQDPTPPPLSPNALASFPTPDETTKLVTDYLTSLHPTKRAKALLSVSFLDLIHSILSSPTSTSISDAQTRFWARRQFVLSPASPSPTSAPQNGHQRVCHHSSLLPLAPAEHIWRILTEAHARVGHVGRDRTVREVQRLWAGVPKEVVGRYVKACPGCRGVRKVGGPSEARRGKQLAGGGGEGDDELDVDAEGEDDDEAEVATRLSSATPTPRHRHASLRPAENVLGLSVTSPPDPKSLTAHASLLSYPPDPSHLHPFSPHPSSHVPLHSSTGSAGDRSPSASARSARSLSPSTRRSVASFDRSSLSAEPASPLDVLAETASALPSAAGPSNPRSQRARTPKSPDPSSPSRVPHFSTLMSSLPAHDALPQHPHPHPHPPSQPTPTTQTFLPRRSLPSPYALGLLPAPPHQESSDPEPAQQQQTQQQQQGSRSAGGSGRQKTGKEGIADAGVRWMSRNPLLPKDKWEEAPDPSLGP